MLIEVYKEKKKENYRLIILPTGRAKNGLTQIKDYGIVMYPHKNDGEKIGEFILWALRESDNEVIENKSNEEFSKQYFNLNSYRKISANYNSISFKYENLKDYKLKLWSKDGYGFSPFKDEDGNYVEYDFKGKPSPNELGTKVMEMFEYKEKYDEQ